MNDKTFHTEIASGKRFPLGKIWPWFLETLSDSRIDQAQRATVELLGRSQLRGQTFLDIGSGSGLFSLLAHRLGATVHSFDYDPSSVACTRKLRDLYADDCRRWQVERGSVLDPGYVQSLGQFDIVYTWGCFITRAIYGLRLSTRRRASEKTVSYRWPSTTIKVGRPGVWCRIKRIYCSGLIGRGVVVGMVFRYFFLRLLVGSCLSKRNLFADYGIDRGMSLIHNWHDWCGGLPCEVASVETVLRFLSERRFILRNIRTTNGLGNNEYLFQSLGSRIDGTADGAI